MAARTRIWLGGWWLWTAVLVGQGAGHPRATPESVGMSATRLARMSAALAAYVDSGRVAGVVAVVTRRGRVAAVDTAGWADREARVPMRSTTIFRIASMSKAITSVGAMMLVEDGKLLLNDPIALYLPAFRHMMVLVAPGDSSTGRRDSLVPATREITVRDLLTHRAGIAYGFLDGATASAYRRAGIHDGIAEGEGTIAANVDKIAAQPLAFQPGTKWQYGLSTDVLGRLIEVVSGMPLDRFLEQRIFRPLQMHDTYFYVPDDKVARIAVPYTRDSTGRLRPMDPLHPFGLGVAGGRGTRGSRTYVSGGAGVFSTAPDYARFLQMLLNGGELDGVRLLSPKTVELMTTSATEDLTPSPMGPSAGFGLGFEVVRDVGATGSYGSVGQYFWGGAYGSTFWVDPKEQLIGVMMIQLVPRPGLTIGERFQTLAYQAIVVRYVVSP